MARTAPAPNMIAVPGMNPGSFVAGGGGDGGGGSGGRGGGKGKNQKGNGSSGEEEPGDGSQSGDDCGAGAPGGCTDCGSSISRGDPVNVVSGEVFTNPVVDLFLPGFFDLEIRRSYSSGYRDRDCGLGWGWAHSLAWEIQVGRRELLVRNGLRQEATFPRLDKPGQRAASGGWAIMRTTQGFTFRPGNEFFHFFEPDPRVDGRFRLASVSFRERGELRLLYDDSGRLSTVVDTAGREVRFGYGASGRIETLSVPSPEGIGITFARYSYDAAGNLVRVEDADGWVTEYTYDERHRLVRQRLGTGLTFFYRYDRSDRCVETWGEYPGMTDPALAPDLPETLRDGQTRARGIHHVVIEYDEDGGSTAYDSVRFQRYFAEENGTISKAVNGSGGVTTRRLDEEGRVVEKIDPLGRSRKYDHDVLGNVTREVYGDLVTEVERDGEGRPLRARDALGGVVEFARNPAGELETVIDQVGSTWHRILGPRGVVLELIAPDGGRYQYQYDAHGNCIYRVEPDGTRYDITYDYWGRRLREVDSHGAEARWEYSPMGRVIAEIDPLGRRKSVQYDALGNEVSITTPDGLTTRIERGGYGWATRVIAPDGTEQRCLYNREGWPIELQNERGERQTSERTLDGMISRQHTFDGRVREVGYDLKSNQAWFDEGEGKFEFERNELDQPTRIVAPDGTERLLEYDARGEMIGAVEPDVRVTWTRDGAGRIVEETLDIEGHRYTLQNRFDGLGRRLGYVSSLGIEIALRRDLMGRPLEYRSEGAVALRYQWGPTADPSTMELAGGGRVEEDYDAGRRLRRRAVVPVGGTASSPEPDWVGRRRDVSVEKLFEYSDVNELVRRSDLRGTTEYEYDPRRHLKAKHENGVTEEWKVDVTENYYEAGPDAPARAYGPGNRLERHGDDELVYDRLGRVIERRSTVDGAQRIWRYGWSPFGLLAWVETPEDVRVELVHDSFARRVVKRVLRRGREGWELERHVHFVWDAASLLAEVDVTSGTPRVLRSYLYEENWRGLPLAQRDHDASGAPGPWIYLIGDQNGTPEELVDGAGQVVGRLERTTFGAAVATPDSRVTTQFRFPGQYCDDETGLHFNRYRYYDPSTGRYLSPDPTDIAGGFNQYGYLPNPIGWFDLMGWTHGMTVESVSGITGISEGDFFNSGYSGLINDQGDCPSDLKSQAKAHSERKFDHVLRDLYSKEQVESGAEVALKGQLPPCRNCHRTMQKLADDTGVAITYRYGTESVTYQGGANGQPGQTTFSDTQFGADYSMRRIPENASGYTYAFEDWNAAGRAYTARRT